MPRHLQNAAVHRQIVVSGSDDHVGVGNQAVFVDLVVVDERATGGLDDADTLEVVDARMCADLGSEDGRIVEQLVHPLETVERLDQARVVVVEAALDDAAQAPAVLLELRVGPLARLNVADRCGTPEADAELDEYRGRLGRIVQSGFHYHYARLIEALYGLERMHELLDDPAILGTKVRAHAGVNNLEGVGVIEAPRGTLIHHYRVDDNGAMTWANLIVATGHNNLAIGRGILQVARRFVDGNRIQEGALNRVSALVRAYDPCLSCSTHALGMVPMVLQLRGPEGELLDEVGTA